MAYASFALLPTLPVIYNLMPSQKHKRRTATSIMAGHFDPLPIISNDVSKPLQDPVRAPSPSNLKVSDMASEQQRPSEETRSALKKSAQQASKRNRTSISTSIMSGTLSKSKGKRVKGVHPDDKENAGSNRDAPRSSSPRLTSSPPASPLPSVVVPKEKPKASGFWRARSANTSASPAPSSLKRKFSMTSHGADDVSSSQVAPSNRKKSRLSTSLDPEAPSSRLFASSDSLSSRSPSPSLDFEPQTLVSSQPKKRLKRRHTSHIILSNKASSEGNPITKSMSHSGITYAENEQSLSAEPSDPAEPLLTRVDAPQLYEVIKKTGIRCKLCERISINVAYMENHLRTAHNDKIDMDAMPQPPPRKPRGPRKNVAVKKGWKGWVEDDLEPQKLILLDKPEVLPERTTRSGRKI